MAKMKFSLAARKQMAADRRAYRAAQRDEGMVEVRVWVPSQEDAERVRLLARELRNGSTAPVPAPRRGSKRS